MSPEEKSLRVRAATVGACIEAATWLLPLWASRASPAHPEDTIPMFVFGITQIPGILLLYLLIPLARLMGIPSGSVEMIVSYAATSLTQGFLFALLAYILLHRSYRSQKP